MKRFLVVFAVIFGLFTGILVADPGVFPDRVVIGTFQAMSGPSAIIGTSVAKGLNSFFNWVNINGGVHSRKIELLIADDQLNPSKTVVEVKRLVEQDRVFSIVAGLGTPGILSVMGYLEENKVPFVYQGGGHTSFAIPPKEYRFSVQPNYLTEGAIMAKYLVEDLEKKRIAIIYRTDDIGYDGLAGVERWLKENDKEDLLVGKYPVAVDRYSFDNEILGMLQQNVDAVIMYIFVPQTPAFLKEAKDYGLDALMLANYANPDPTTITLSEGAAERLRATAWVMADANNENYAKYINIYQESYPGEIPNSYAAAGFIAAEIFTEGLRRAGEEPTREKLVKALESMGGWSGLITPELTYKPYDPNDEACRIGVNRMYVLEVVDQIWTVVTDWISVN